jgi:hypothetical protein
VTTTPEQGSKWGTEKQLVTASGSGKWHAVSAAGSLHDARQDATTPEQDDFYRRAILRRIENRGQ